MTLDVGHYLEWEFDLATANCWHLVRAAWRDLTGVDLGDRTPEAISFATLTGRFAADVPAFREIAEPEDPCLVLMTRRHVVPHVGVLAGGRVLQVAPAGASYLPMPQAALGFERVRYYR